MVKGLDLFRQFFREYEGAFVLIGGAACHEWFAQQGQDFRATKDLDIVLIVEMVEPTFVAALRSFIAEGKYEIQEKSDQSPVLYRFSRPGNFEFPFMLEFFSRKPEQIELGDRQIIVPIPSGTYRHSLSAILMSEVYYSLIRDHRTTTDGLQFANPTALIPLKSLAWMNLIKQKDAGETVDSKNITKHRNDVFRLASTLPGQPGPELPASIVADVSQFLANFPAASNAWAGILASFKNTMAEGLTPDELRSVILPLFRLPSE